MPDLGLWARSWLNLWMSHRIKIHYPVGHPAANRSSCGINKKWMALGYFDPIHCHFTDKPSPSG